MMTGTKKRLVILDSHALIHRAYHALPPLTTKKGELVNAVYGFLLVFFKVVKEIKPDYIVAAFDAPAQTFREKEYAEYKAQRPKAPDELYNQIPLIKKILQSFNVPIFEAPGYEADDIIGAISSLAPKKQAYPDIETFIVTGDMDVLQLIDARTKVYTLRKSVQDTVIYDEGMVRQRYGLAPAQMIDFKALRGDPADNIPGVKGIGEKTAIDLLGQFATVENLYEALEEEKPNEKIRPKLKEILLAGKDSAFVSKRLATIRKDVPIDFKIQEARWGGYDKGKVIELLEEFGFQSLIDKLPGARESSFGTRSASQRIDASRFALGHRELSNGLPSSSAGHSKPTIPAEAQAVELRPRKFMVPKEDSRARDILGEIEELYKAGILSKQIYELEKALIPVISQMEQNGIKVDSRKLDEISKGLELEICTLESKIYELAKESFNINSPQQLSHVLFEKLGLPTMGLKKTPKGVISTSAPELEKLKMESPIIELIQKYKELAKLKTGFVDALPRAINPKDDRIHPKFHQLGAATGRLSCSDPNLQNIPIKGKWGKEIRKAFVAEAGFKLLSLDYSQMELRIAAHIAKDSKMIQAFKEGKDIHKITAAQIYNVSETEVTEEMRYHAKTLNFGVLYGMGPHAFAQSSGISFAEAQKFIQEYMNDFQGIREYIEDTKQTVKKNGYVETIFGRKRFLPEINSRDPMLRNAAERMAINLPAQGTAADIMKMAMVAIGRQKTEDRRQKKLLLQIHDELLFEIKEEFVEDIALKIKEVMENVWQISVPLMVEVKAGDNWGEIKDLDVV